MRLHRPATVRSPAFRSMALRREKAFSIGLKSGLYGGRKRSAAPAGEAEPEETQEEQEPEAEAPEAEEAD